MTGKSSKRTAAAQVGTLKLHGALDTFAPMYDFLKRLTYIKIDRKTKLKVYKKIVANGPWITAILLLIVLPQLLIFSKVGAFLGISGFFTFVFFNQSAWVLLSVLLANNLFLAASLSYIAIKKKKGWIMMGIIQLINITYIFSQLAQNTIHYTAALFSLLVALLIMLIHIDIKKHYKKK